MAIVLRYFVHKGWYTGNLVLSVVTSGGSSSFKKRAWSQSIRSLAMLSLEGVCTIGSLERAVLKEQGCVSPCNPSLTRTIAVKS